MQIEIIKLMYDLKSNAITPKTSFRMYLVCELPAPLIFLSSSETWTYHRQHFQNFEHSFDTTFYEKTSDL